MERITLRVARHRAGLTQEALALASGLRQAQISRLELATMNPSFTTVLKLARALHLEPGRLRFNPTPSRRGRTARVPPSDQAGV